jgi:hypothetical protein
MVVTAGTARKIPKREGGLFSVDLVSPGSQASSTSPTSRGVTSFHRIFLNRIPMAKTAIEQDAFLFFHALSTPFSFLDTPIRSTPQDVNCKCSSGSVVVEMSMGSFFRTGALRNREFG